MTLMHGSDDSDVGEMHVVDIMDEISPADLAGIRSLDLKTTEGIRKALSEEVDFLTRFEATVFVRPANYRARYEERNRPDWAPPK